MLGSSVGKRGEREMTIRGRERERRCPSHGDGKGGAQLPGQRRHVSFAGESRYRALDFRALRTFKDTRESRGLYIYMCIRLSYIRILRIFECLRHSRITQLIYIRAFEYCEHSNVWDTWESHVVYIRLSCIWLSCVRLSCIRLSCIRLLYTRLSCIPLSCIRTLQAFECLRYSRITWLVYICAFDFRIFEYCEHSNAWNTRESHDLISHDYIYVHSTFVYSNIANIRMLETLENHAVCIHTYIRLSCIRTLQAFECLRHSRITQLVYIRTFDFHAFDFRAFDFRILDFRAFHFRAFERCKHSNAWDTRARIIHVHSNVASIQMLETLEHDVYTYVHSTFVHLNVASIQILVRTYTLYTYIEILTLRYSRITRLVYVHRDTYIEILESHTACIHTRESHRVCTHTRAFEHSNT